MISDDRDALVSRIHELEGLLAEKKREVERLQQGMKASEAADVQVSITEFEDTLKRLVQRVAMILQAEKCAILILDKETGELVARAPAHGIAPSDLRLLRVKVSEGVSGAVYRTEHPIIIDDAIHDPRTVKENVALLHVRNGLVVPLVVEKRDEENRVTNRITIGVLCVFNKRYDGLFNEEDVRLLERLSRNAASVISNAQMYKELVEEKEKLVHTIESLYAGLLLISERGTLMQMNARARQIFEVVGDPIGRPFVEMIQHEKAIEVLGRMLSVIDQSEAAESDDDVRAAEEVSVAEPDSGEERIYQLHAAQVRGEDHRLIGTAVIMNDITEIRNLDRMKTEFVAIAAHELRTPMTPIKGFISMLAQDPDDSFTPEDRHEYYTIIEQNVDRLGRLINDLLNVTRIERGIAMQLFWEEADLPALVESVFEVQRGMTNTDKHPLVMDAEPAHLIATVGRDQIEQIFQNLVSNAIKYSPEGGEVVAIIRDEPDKGTVLMGVRDHGTGLPDSAKAKLFKPYRRIHNPKTASVKGTGIGLFLVKNLVEAHHGNIWVETEMGKGSTFWFRIPKAPPEAGEGEAAAPAT
ncbi:MAG: ATP-binding protein [Armatimonadetes bacterium]|nr:ATP-binding protein [Armatimonadota bacterium]